MSEIAKHANTTSTASGSEEASREEEEKRSLAVRDEPAPIAEEQPKEHTFIERQAMRIARWPKTHFWVSFALAFGLSAFGMVVGEFSVSNEEGGWQSRGTLIADRTTQILMVTRHQKLLFSGSDAVWDDLTTNIQPGWEDDDLRSGDRRLEELEEFELRLAEEDRARKTWMDLAVPSFDKFNDPAMNANFRESLPLPHQFPGFEAFLQDRLAHDNSRRLAGCGEEQLRYYTDGNLTNGDRLWPVWKTKNEESTALDPKLVEELCANEEQTQRVLEEQGLCIACDGDVNVPGSTCLPPYGIVLYARLLVDGGMDMDCAGLAAAWGPYQKETEAEWKRCVVHVEANPTSIEDGTYSEHCPEFFHPSILDELFDTSGRVQYTSSIFATTSEMIDPLYEIAENTDQFGRGGEEIEGAYDTQYGAFLTLFADSAVGRDMLLACGSAFITTIAIVVHTRSPFLTLVGVVQILFAFPLAFFAYKFLGGWDFFPFLNFIGVFVVFALGADHVFVSVDKWKNARLDYPDASTEEIAAKALPDAASAMLLTTTTTAAAFFGTAICPVAPVRLFAIFCGMLIVFDYIMDVALVFPALCIYDGYRNNLNCCILIGGRKPEEDETEENEEGKAAGNDRSGTLVDETHANGSDGVSEAEEQPMRVSLIRRILLGYYNLLHSIRWPLLVVCFVALVVCGFYATKLRLPTSSDVAILTDKIEYERANLWRSNLLSETIKKTGGSTAVIAWGVIPADTGDQNNPASWSTLELDNSFDLTTKEAQTYMRDYCPRFFEQDFAELPYDGFQCSMNKFDSWLQSESAAMATNGTASDIYNEHCNGGTELPIDPSEFHPCMIAWSQAVEEYDVMANDGVVELIIFRFGSRVRYDAENKKLESEWNLIESWMVEDQKTAPAEVAKAFFSSQDFWWYDTNYQMFRTAYGSAAIAIAASAIVILLSSRSLVMTLFSVLSIVYVLGSVTSMMVAGGWTLGFLESICFAILIGVSVDFVIHFSHAYVSMQGPVAREVRTKHALIDMGPSILAAAFTTMAGAMIMLFCYITFFTKFAYVLFFAIVQATIGSFVFFLTLTDCIGPVEPQHMADRLMEQCRGDAPETVVAASTPAANNSSTSGVTKKPTTPVIAPGSSFLVEDIEYEIEV